VAVDLIDVRRALESDAIVPCFQPIVELRTGRLAGFEILARWQHPDLGLILPENFISLAEEHGLIGSLTHQIMRKAFMSAPLLPEPLVLAFNFSPIQLHYRSLPFQIREAAKDSGFPLQRVVVEITESALVNNLEPARMIAIELKEMGCRLALDDFGTGYSSLRHLQALPFSQLKIDRSFIESMTGKRESRKIVAAVVGLGHSLGMITVAEGVETEEQANMLLWLGATWGRAGSTGALCRPSGYPICSQPHRGHCPTKCRRSRTRSVFPAWRRCRSSAWRNCRQSTMERRWAYVFLTATFAT
jgi:EAL domain-containing protein (putative c-di-GMP-specific phosphodiesterase class I)